MRGNALESYKKLIQSNYLDPANKTNVNYEVLVRLIPANSGVTDILGTRFAIK